MTEWDTAVGNVFSSLPFTNAATPKEDFLHLLVIYSRFIYIMSQYQGVGGSAGCPTVACVAVGCGKGFPRATFGFGIRGRQKKETLDYRHQELTNEFRLEELESEPGVVWSMGSCAETISYIVNLTAYE